MSILALASGIATIAFAYENQSFLTETVVEDSNDDALSIKQKFNLNYLKYPAG